LDFLENLILEAKEENSSIPLLWTILGLIHDLKRKITKNENVYFNFNYNFIIVN
jgi:hypothetical protein